MFFCLPDNPVKAKFLSKEQKAIARARSIRQVGQAESVRVNGLQWREIGERLLDLKVRSLYPYQGFGIGMLIIHKLWFTALMYFPCNVSFASLPVFLPTILEAMGFTSIDAQGLSAPPYFLAFLLGLVTTFIAGKTSQRGYTIFCLSMVGAAGYMMLAIGTSRGVRYAGVYLAAAGIFPSIGDISPWTLNNQGSDTRRGTSIAIIQSSRAMRSVAGDETLSYE